MYTGGAGPSGERHGQIVFFFFRHGRSAVQKVGKQPPDEVLLFFFRQQMSTTVVLILSRLGKLCRKLLKVSNKCCRRVDPNPITCRNWYNKCRRKRWIPKHQSYDRVVHILKLLEHTTWPNPAARLDFFVGGCARLKQKKWLLFRIHHDLLFYAIPNGA